MNHKKSQSFTQKFHSITTISHHFIILMEIHTIKGKKIHHNKIHHNTKNDSLNRAHSSTNSYIHTDLSRSYTTHTNTGDTHNNHNNHIQSQVGYSIWVLKTHRIHTELIRVLKLGTQSGYSKHTLHTGYSHWTPKYTLHTGYSPPPPKSCTLINSSFGTRIRGSRLGTLIRDANLGTQSGYSKTTQITQNSFGTPSWVLNPHRIHTEYTQTTQTSQDIHNIHNILTTITEYSHRTPQIPHNTHRKYTTITKNHNHSQHSYIHNTFNHTQR